MFFGGNMIYFDNSASSLIKPKEVQQMVSLALSKYSANPGRSGHKASLITANQVEFIREKTAEMMGLSHFERVIFTQNCSDALNIAILGSARRGGHIVCTENEHNSVLRPLEHLKQSGMIDYSVAKQSNSFGISEDDIKREIKPNTYLVICNHISNVNGDVAEIEKIGKYCRDKNILFMVDGAQSGGHEDLNMERQNIDILTLAPHKGFYALQGLGVLLFSDKIDIEPIRFGGTGTNSLELVQPSIYPEKLEVGTIATPAILGFGGGLNFVERNYNEIREKLDDLTTFLHYELSKLPVKIYTNPQNSNGVLSFNIPNIHSNEVANILDEKYGICTRGGYHCAPKKHEALKTLDTGTVRISLSYFNTITEIQHFIASIKHILKSETKKLKLN